MSRLGISSLLDLRFTVVKGPTLWTTPKTSASTQKSLSRSAGATAEVHSESRQWNWTNTTIQIQGNFKWTLFNVRFRLSVARTDKPLGTYVPTKVRNLSEVVCCRRQFEGRTLNIRLYNFRIAVERHFIVVFYGSVLFIRHTQAAFGDEIYLSSRKLNVRNPLRWLHIIIWQDIRRDSTNQNDLDDEVLVRLKTLSSCRTS